MNWEEEAKKLMQEQVKIAYEHTVAFNKFKNTVRSLFNVVVMLTLLSLSIVGCIYLSNLIFGTYLPHNVFELAAVSCYLLLMLLMLLMLPMIPS